MTKTRTEQQCSRLAQTEIICGQEIKRRQNKDNICRQQIKRSQNDIN